jgi:Flp pilus assembly protein TadG
MIRSPRTARRGSAVMVLTALMATFLVGVAAFVVDLGYIAVARSELQNAADAAALAGAAQLQSEEAQQALYNATKNGLPKQNYYNGDNAMRQEAQTFGQAHRAGAVTLVVDKNLGNKTDGDILLGYMNPLNHKAAMTYDTYPYNAVQVRTYRDATHSGSLNLFFAGVFAQNTKDVGATGTAMLIPAPWKLLPITMHIDDYLNLLNNQSETGETDDYTYDPDITPLSDTDFSNRVLGGTGGAADPDNIPEFKLFPDKGGTPGNFGTVDLGPLTGSTSDLERQIRGGLSPSDVTQLQLQGKLTNGKFVATLSTPVMLSGDSGVSWSIENSLTDAVGQARTIPLYRTVTLGGTIAQYEIVGFANVVIVKADNGGGGGKRILVQPIAPFKVMSSPDENGLGGVSLVR